MIYESKFMRRMRLEGSSAKTDKKNSVSFVSDSPKEDSENKLIEKEDKIKQMEAEKKNQEINSEFDAQVFGNALGELDDF